jgi:cysteine synthase A
VGGQHIGGCTETFDAFNQGELQELFEINHVAFKPTGDADAYSFLPAWLHPR